VARPNWEYIRIDVLLPEHPKLDGLSAAAKWTLIELWCYCGRNRTDGIVTPDRWRRFGTKAIRARLVECGLAEPVLDGKGGYLMHDYIEHNRSRNEIDELSAKRAEAGRRGGRARRA
jgi:hypothetical protein